MVRGSTGCIVGTGRSSAHNIKGIVVSDTAATVGDTAATACTAAAADTGCITTAAAVVLRRATVQAGTGCSNPSQWRLLI
jgi:hypothetical protein